MKTTKPVKSNQCSVTKADLIAGQDALIDTLASNLYFGATDYFQARKSQYSFRRDEARALCVAVRSQAIMLRFLRTQEPRLFFAVIKETRGYFQRSRARQARAEQPFAIAA